MLLDHDPKRHDVVGEDTRELFEAIERSFDVQISDYSDLAGIRISDLAAKINALANYPSREKCLSAVAFYRLRLALEQVASVSGRSVRPATPVAYVLPWRNRRALWKQLEDASGLTFPRLALPGWLPLICLVLPFSILAVAKVYGILPFGWIPLFLWSLVLCMAMLWLSLPLARALPKAYSTVGALTKSLVALNYAEFATHDAGSSASDIEEALLHLAAFGSGLAVSDISPATRIPQDLNIY